MRDTTDKTPLIEEIKEAWDDLELGAKVSICWLLVLAAGLIVLGIIFPIVGLILLALVAVFATIGAICYLLDY